MSAQHTPGPWEVLHDHPDAETAPAIAYIKAVNRGMDFEEIALLFGCVEQPQQEANARLMAAAPELLAALRDVIDWLDDGNRQLSDECAVDVTNARLTINKATT